MKTAIYGLIDPITRECRYVGKTNAAPKYRLGQHVRGVHYGPRTHKSNWIASLLRESLAPSIIVLETIQEDWREAEQFWICYLKSIGCRLTNATAGGDGVSGRVVSEETRRKIGDRHRGKVISPEARTKMSDSRKGRKFSERHRLSMSASRQQQERILLEQIKERVSEGATPLQLKALGFSNRAIGRQIGVSHHAVKSLLARTSC